MAACAPGTVSGAEESSIALEASSLGQGCSYEGRQQDELLPILVTLRPADLADPSFFEQLAACAPLRHLQIIARLEPPTEWQAASDPYAAIGSWLNDLDRFLQVRHGAIRYFELGRRPDLQFGPSAYAFLVEKVGTLLRSSDPGAVLVLGSLGDASEEWLGTIDSRRLTPYIRGVALEDPVDLHEWLPRLERDYPGMPVWLHSDQTQEDPAALLARFHEARANGVSVLVFQVAENSLLERVLVNLYRALPPRFVVDAQAAKEPDITGAESSAPARLWFADPLGPERAVVLLNSTDLPLATDSKAIVNVRAFELSTGDERAAHVVNDAQASGRARIEVSGSIAPTLLRFVIAREPRPAPEAVAVTGERELTAEEIIAGERAFEAAQARVMDHYEAKARISYHYRAETLGEAIDVSSVNRFSWSAGAGEYEEIDLFINGARWHGKPPSLPFIQAEKIQEVPLEIRLDQSYAYRLEGTDTVQGQPCYVISFEPTGPGASLYSGEVWIQEQTFVRMKIRLVQHGLKQPITSNTDVIEYGPIPGRTVLQGPERTFWLPVSGYRQMVFTVLGREIAAERTVIYEEFLVNSPEFNTRREAAYASDNTILRDDETGYSYLEREGGIIRRRNAESLVNVAFFGGMGVGSDGSLTTPFAGLNYFNFNWRNTGTQLDLSFAGLLAGIVWTDPSLDGSRWELTLDGRFVGVRENFHGSNSDDGVEEEDLKTLQQRGILIAAHPITSFQKVIVELELDDDKYSRDPDTDPNFDLPPDGLTTIGTARWNYIRNGYKLDLWYSHGHRFTWADWGMVPDPNATASARIPARGSGDDTDFERWGLTGLKSYYLGSLQKISLGLTVFDSSGLDHFSRFRIGDFRNARVRGFSNKDLTFDRGVVAQAEYKFTLRGGGASMGLGVEGAVIENPDDYTSREYLVGGGASISVSGPWSTLVTFLTSFGLASSLDVSISGPSLRVVMVKTMDHWPHRRQRER